MAQNSRSSKEGDMAFDFSSSSAVMQILKTLRNHTELTSSVRNEIRDLIFSYTNGKGEEAERQTIETRLLSAGITPLSIGQSIPQTKAEEVPKKEVPKGGFSNGRVTPHFVGVAPAVPKSDILTPQPTLSPQAQPTSVPVVTSISSAPVVKEFKVQAKPEVPKDSPAPASQSIPRIIPTIPVSRAEVLENKEKRSEAPAPEIEIDSNVDTTSLLERIRIIKADINTRAGNPVNLVSMNNTVGREYMSALLEAMKQLGSGNASTITEAMKRLEIAYEQALSVIEMSAVPEQSQLAPTKPVQMQVKPSAVPEVLVVPRVQNSPALAPVTQKQSVPIVTSTPAVRPVTPAASPVSGFDNSTPSNNPPLGVTRAVARPVSAVPAPQVTPTLVPTQAPRPATMPLRRPIPMDTTPAEVMQASQPASAVPINSSKYSQTKSVAMATPLHKVEELPTLTEIKNRSESGNPLYTGDITDGLEQLLSEWSIFHKSGVFGTGPKGSNHPLYKKLQSLKIPLIIAGRFEGATEEVRQSITDYMNGWRYEQGIVYEKEETFEIYLRRVVKHILETV